MLRAIMRNSKRERILFVCANNICRSPLAAAIFRDHAARAGILQKIDLDSAAINRAHVGHPVDPRALAVAARHGYELPPRRARKVGLGDFDRFTYILAMDEDNLRALLALRPTGHAGHVGLLLDLAPQLGVRDVPDPYHGSLATFERVIGLIEPAATTLVRDLATKLRRA